ncbi:hypothetical protein DCMF_18690 [Candidatus Formimonas warabiya]|uniref:MerR family transcriptional regulator n=1 Tax=Formimonas warabiya TaxID=1761012 RepID=A0A3G1L1R0_FORW1|nr:hypothetical protein DCMF_18690 [Candidatus Formimonas warabiya]
MLCQCPGVWKESGLTVAEVAYEAGIDPALVQKLLELGLINYQGRISNPRISRSEVTKIRQMVRLRRDLGINWSGVSLVLDLLEEIQALREEIKKLQSW